MAKIGFGAGEGFHGGRPQIASISIAPPCPPPCAFGGDAALIAEPLHRIDQMQHDAIAAGADRMANANRAAVDIEPIARNLAGGAGEPERLAAELVIVPGGKQVSTCAANASLSSDNSISLRPS